LLPAWQQTSLEKHLSKSRVHSRAIAIITDLICIKAATRLQIESTVLLLQL
jgi:hypothetical protein